MFATKAKFLGVLWGLSADTSRPQSNCVSKVYCSEIVALDCMGNAKKRNDRNSIE